MEIRILAYQFVGFLDAGGFYGRHKKVNSANIISVRDFLLAPAPKKIVFLNQSKVNVTVKTYNQSDTLKWIAYASYTVVPNQEVYIRARGKCFQKQFCFMCSMYCYPILI